MSCPLSKLESGHRFPAGIGRYEPDGCEKHGDVVEILEIADVTRRLGGVRWNGRNHGPAC